MSDKKPYISSPPLFAASMIETVEEKRENKKWLTLPFSLIVHAVLLAAFVVVPLLSVSHLPEVKVTNIFLAATPPPPPPPPPAAKKKTTSAASSAQKQTVTQTFTSGKFVAPVSIPEKIVESNDLPDFGFEGGEEGGHEGGVEGGVVGGIIGGVEGGQLLESEQAVRIGSMQQPRKIREVKPVYPQAALAARISGQVIVEAETDIYGKVRNARIVSGHPLLNQAALDAVMQWQYEPYIINGIPKPVKFTVVVTFSLQNQ